MIRIVPGEGADQESDFSDEEAADPMVTFATVNRLASKPRSKLRPVTSVPACEFRLTGMFTPVAPGSPEPLPTVSEAPACASTPMGNERRNVVSRTITIV